MSQTDDRLDAIEAITAARAQADDSVQDLIALLLDPARFAEHVAGLESRITAGTAAKAEMDAELAAFDSQAEETRQKNTAEHATINATGDLDQLIAKEAELKTRGETIAKLKREWHVFGESDEVHSGFREPLFPALVKARRAHDAEGRLAHGDPDDPHFSVDNSGEASRPAWQVTTEHRDGLRRATEVQNSLPVPPRESVVVRRRQRRADFKQRGIRK
jgi:hypothetical protein